MWDCINHLTGKRSKTTDIISIDHNGASIHDQEEIANIFNISLRSEKNYQVKFLLQISNMPTT